MFNGSDDQELNRLTGDCFLLKKSRLNIDHYTRIVQISGIHINVLSYIVCHVGVKRIDRSIKYLKLTSLSSVEPW